jgi:hypothetical protein
MTTKTSITRTVLQLSLLPVTAALLPFYPIWKLWKRITGPVAVYVVRDH